MRRLGLVLTLIVCAGCGDGVKRVAITGKVTADGAPVDNAVLQFIPLDGTKSPGAIGRSDAEGNFTLISSRENDKGIPPGEYKVRVSRLVAHDGALLPPDARQADHPGCKESIPTPYSSLEGTTLTATISESGGNLTINIPAKLVSHK